LEQHLPWLCYVFDDVAASLDAAVNAAAAVLAASSKPVLLGGPPLRANHWPSAFKQLAEASKVKQVLMWQLQAQGACNAATAVVL
jgi:thiamine pyrophosphate-dependent acetolactate synthase large subunit-like protein